MPDTTVKLQDITPVKSTFDNDDQLLLINPTGEARISKEDFLDAMPDDAITLIGDITTTGIEGDTVAKQLGALENSKAPAITETTESSAIATFTDGADDLVMHNIVAEIAPVQSGSGDPAPDNIRPISGWTGCNVTRTGKNLFDKEAITPNSWIVVNTTTIEPAPNFYVTDYIPVSVGQPITCTAKGASRSIYYDKNKNPIEYFSWNTGVLNPLHDGYIRTTVSDTYFDTTQIELGSSTTAYEAPQVQTVTIDWTTEAGTVYGGTIDVATGLLTVDRGIITDFSTLWQNPVSAADGTYRWGITVSNVYSGASQKSISSFAPYKRDFNYGGIRFFGYNNAINIFLPNNNRPEVLALLDGQQIVYELATPQTYQLTPQQLKTLLGTNNVWADTGNVSVTYPADTKMFIEKLTMPTEDDMVANQAITSGKYFMVGNSLYLALANIASGAQITIGTNAQRVSLADALNTINS